ncbi:unnamed protein product [marine sediment metagenome]|uniref:Uncharacterized protein n=1 Tax=marine sediment metagenome TaxID=412755 RepID=X1DEN0_9ZZZZ
MYLLGNKGIVKHWAGVVAIRYRWSIIQDALKYLWNAVRGYHIAGLD